MARLVEDLMETAIATGEEDRILRTWTPLILRSILLLSSIVMAVGIAQSAALAPGFFVRRFHAIQLGQLHVRESVPQLLGEMRLGDPHGLMTIGLYLLTLVPLVRVAFTFFLFLKERDFVYVTATAYVLAALAVGVMLGRVG
jgi:uncharacterized membrane protein